MIGPWEAACRAAWPDTPDEDHPVSLAYCRYLDSVNTPSITPRPGYEPRSRFLRSMCGLPPVPEGFRFPEEEPLWVKGFPNSDEK